MRNGKCLTLRISECPKADNERSLADILEAEVEDKYFLSEEATKILLNKSLAEGKSESMVLGA